MATRYHINMPRVGFEPRCFEDMSRLNYRQYVDYSANTTDLKNQLFRSKEFWKVKVEQTHESFYSALQKRSCIKTAFFSHKHTHAFNTQKGEGVRSSFNKHSLSLSLSLFLSLSLSISLSVVYMCSFLNSCSIK